MANQEPGERENLFAGGGPGRVHEHDCRMAPAGIGRGKRSGQAHDAVRELHVLATFEGDAARDALGNAFTAPCQAGDRTLLIALKLDARFDGCLNGCARAGKKAIRAVRVERADLSRLVYGDQLSGAGELVPHLQIDERVAGPFIGPREFTQRLFVDRRHLRRLPGRPHRHCSGQDDRQRPGEPPPAQAGQLFEPRTRRLANAPSLPLPAHSPI